MSTAIKEKNIAGVAAKAPEGTGIPDSVYALSKLAQEHFTLTEGGVVEVPKDFYEQLLPEGLTIGDVKKVQEHNAQLVSAVGIALGEFGVAALKKDKKLDGVSLQTSFAKDKAGFSLPRSKELLVGAPGAERTPETKFGQLAVSYKTFGSSNKGLFKKSRDYVVALATKELS